MTNPAPTPTPTPTPTATTTATTVPAPAPAGSAPSETTGARVLRVLLTQRIALLAVLVVVVVVWFLVLDAGGYLTAAYDFDYMSATLINAVPLAMLGLAELLVIVSGRGGIDLSVGAIVSLAGMVFGFTYGVWGWPLWLAILATAGFGALCGALNGFLVAHVGFPALIATLATFYAYKSLAIVVNDQSPISTAPIQGLFSISRSVELPLFGRYVPDVPLGLFTFLLPTVVVVWLLVARATYGRRLYGIGTNDVAARWAGLPVRRTRFGAYTCAGLISGLVAVVTVAQFASARPDAGVTGNGMALPAITIAVLGGVAITGGIGRVAGVVLATLLVVWLNAGILLAFEGNAGAQFQLLALGAVLVFAALLNGLTTRRYGGTR
ncbi:MAG: ABC transporter permease [Pseudonocardia sp.]